MAGLYEMPPSRTIDSVSEPYGIIIFAMRITVNGEAREVTAGQSVASLLTDLGIQAERVAVELNLKIVDRQAFTGTSLNDGDRVEVIGFIGGGRSDDDER